MGADVSAQIFGEDGKVDFQLGAEARTEAIAGEIEGSVGVDILGGEVGVSGGVNFGIGAHADVGYRDAEQLSFKEKAEAMILKLREE